MRGSERQRAVAVAIGAPPACHAVALAKAYGRRRWVVWPHYAFMPLHDDNRIEDIMGCYLLASAWREGESEEDIQRQLGEFVDRVRDKLRRNRNQTRGNWFTIALEHAQQAQQQYRDRQFGAGRGSLRQAWEHLQRGNKASRRRATFIAGSDGAVQHV